MTGTIHAKSEELGIPYANMLMAFMTETVFVRIVESFYADHFYLRNREDLNLSVFKRKQISRLQFYYAGEIEEKSLAKYLDRIFVRGQHKGIELDYEIIRIRKKAGQGQAIILVSGKADKHLIQVEVELTGLLEQVEGVKEEYRLFMETEKRITFLCYPVFKMLGEKTIQLLKSMELIQDMDIFYQIYEILGTENLNGRRMREILLEYSLEAKIPLEEKRAETIAGYSDSVYMKKKWKMYLKREKRTEPEWNQVVEIVSSYLGPLWQAICRDEVFFGDWMPELGRFLM